MGARKKGLIPKLKSFLEALGDRYQRVLQVIDEALSSEDLKDKKWAVDLILKRTPAEEPQPEPTTGKKRPLSPRERKEALQTLSDEQLLLKIRALLDDGVLPEENP